MALATIATEIRVVETAVRRALPQAVDGPIGRAVQPRIRRIMADYFRRLAARLPASEIKGFVGHRLMTNANVEIDENRKKAIAADAEQLFDVAVAGLSRWLASQLVGPVGDCYRAGWIAAMREADEEIDAITKGGTVVEQWARRHCELLVAAIDEETKRRLAGVIARGIAERLGVIEVAKALRAECEGMSVVRSRLIAMNETSQALETAAADKARALGNREKQWLTMGDDRVSDGCAENEAAGWVGIDESFPSGHDRPPRFPGCRCAAVYRGGRETVGLEL